MVGRTHDLAAFTALSVAAVSLPLPHISLSTILVAVVVGQLGGLAPDIDEPTAPLWHLLPAGGFLSVVLRQMLGGHRFISHSLIGMFIFGFLGHMLGVVLQPSFPSLDMSVVWCAFMLGVASHLFMDGLTKQGIPLFLPLPLKVAFPPLVALRVTTGSWVERVVVFPALVLLNVYIYQSHYGIFLALLRQHIS
jgi:inner membrane protein